MVIQYQIRISYRWKYLHNKIGTKAYICIFNECMFVFNKQMSKGLIRIRI